MAEDITPSPKGSQNEAILKEIRDNFSAWTEYWRDAREQRQTDIRYLCGDPWDPKDRKAREDAGRPCISHDELNQYVNQCVNAARQNKRGIKIEPAGNGATEESAALREDIARTIEYKSRAQSVYLRAYQDAVEGGWGACRVSRRYVHPDTDDQEIVIKPIPNPESVIYDPNCKEEDWSDARGCFVLDNVPREQFKQLYPQASVVDFSTEDQNAAPGWITDKTVIVAEYWKVKDVPYTGKTGRKSFRKELWQYITNGVEILHAEKQIGEEIPIAVATGLTRYVDDGNGTKRILFSLIRFARDPQMSLAYLTTLEMEEAGLTPKAPFMGYVGQFETDQVAWDNITKQPVGRIQVDPVVDAATNQVLPLPQRVQFTPNFAAYEVAKESARRAIQAAMGINPLPTAAQRQNDKSGVALQKIQQQSEVGSFHFVDGYERMITRVGRIINSWIPEVYDTEREIGLHQVDESRKVVTINGQAVPGPDGVTQVSAIGDGNHDVTVSTGPSSLSQYDEASDTVDLLAANLEKIPPPGSPQAKILSLGLRLKRLGPLGDKICDILDPPQEGGDIPPQVQAAVQKQGQELNALHAYAQQLEAKLQQAEFEKKAQIVREEAETARERMRIEADLAKAEINTKAQRLEERLAFVEDLAKQLHMQAHEAGMQAQEQAHEHEMAERQAEVAAQQQQMAQVAEQNEPESA